MPNLFMTRIGRVLVPADAEAEEALERVPERSKLKIAVSLPRLPETHRLFFGVVADACEHWPDRADPIPEGNAEKLRAWLLCEVGYRESNDYPISDDPDIARMTYLSVAEDMNRARARGEYPFLREGIVTVPDTKKKVRVLRIFRARSIAKEALDEIEFKHIRQQCFEVIENVTGIDVKTFIKAFHERNQRIAAGKEAAKAAARKAEAKATRRTAA